MITLHASPTVRNSAFPTSFLPNSLPASGVASDEQWIMLKSGSVVVSLVVGTLST